MLKISKTQIKVRRDNHVIELDGKKFRLKTIKYKKIEGIIHEDYALFEEFNEKEYQDDKDFIVSKLLKHTPNKVIMDNIIGALSIKEIKRVKKLLNDGARIKKQDGCLGLRIDGGKGKSAYINIFD